MRYNHVMKQIFLLLPMLFLTACVTNRLPPELVEKTFSPTRSGVIQHKQPEDGKEQHQYQLASVNMMRKFCGGSFKVLSEKKFSQDSGTSSTIALSKNMAVSQEDTDDMVRIQFTCTDSSELSLEQ